MIKLPSNKHSSSTIGFIKELKSFGALGPRIIEVISKFSFLTELSGGKLVFINKTI